MAYGGCNMIITSINNNVLSICLNRIEKHNAFNSALLSDLHEAILQGIGDADVKAIVLKANGRFFSAGADLAEMQAAANLPMPDNIAHAKQLSDTLATWHQSPKPTLCVVQGSAFGGALGFIAASDVAIAVPYATFCFSEAKLGLIPAVISPYILEVMGLKMTKRLFLSAEIFTADHALQYQLIDAIVSENELKAYTENCSHTWTQLPAETLSAIKSWLANIHEQPITEALQLRTAEQLAKMRTHPIAQQKLQEFLKSKNT